MVNTQLILLPPFCMVLIPEIRSIDFSIPISSVSSILFLVEPKRTGQFSRFVWANGRAAGIGITIPVCSIGRLPLLEPLPSLPNIEWKRRQSFRNKMAEAANETSFEEFFFFNLTFVFVVKYKSSCLYLVIRLLILRIHFGVVNIW